MSWDFASGPVVKTPPSNTGGPGSIPDQGTKIPYAVGWSQNFLKFCLSKFLHLLFFNVLPWLTRAILRWLRTVLSKSVSSLQPLNLFQFENQIWFFFFFLFLCMFRKFRMLLCSAKPARLFLHNNSDLSFPPVGYEAILKEIKQFENRYRGRELPGFVNYKTFEIIIKKQVKVLEEPAVDMLHTVTGGFLVLL